MTADRSGDDGHSLTELDFSNCRCSRYHTCQWCHEHSSVLLDPDRFEVTD